MIAKEIVKTATKFKIEIGVISIWLCSRFAIYFQIPTYMDEGIIAFYANRALKDPSARFDIMFGDKGLLTTWFSAWVTGLGFSPFMSVRIYALICSLSTLAVMYFISVKLFGVIAGRIFLLLYTFSPFTLIHDVVGFLDPGVSLVAASTFYLMIKYFENKDIKYIFIIGIIVGLGTLIRESSHYYIFLIPLSIVINEVLNPKSKQALKIISHIALFLITIYPIYSMKKLTPLGYPQIKPIVENHYLFTDFLKNPFKMVEANTFFYSQLLIGYAILICFLLLISATNFKKLTRYLKGIYIICCFWIITPLIGALLFASLPSSRYITATIPFMILAIVSNFQEVSLKNSLKMFRSKIFRFITTVLIALTLSQSAFMTLNLQRYVLPGLDDWQYFRAQQLSGSGLHEIINKIELVTSKDPNNNSAIKVLGVNSYNNGILSVYLNETKTFEERQVDVFGYYEQKLTEFDFVLIEEGDIGVYTSWGWPLFYLGRNNHESMRLPLYLNEKFYDELKLSHERYFEYMRPRNGATVVLYVKTKINL